MSKSLHHSFDIHLAAQYGVNEAILIHHLSLYPQHTFQDIKVIFHYLTEKELQKAVKNLLAHKLIHIEVPNENV